MKPTDLRGGARFTAAVRNSIYGLRKAWVHERAFRAEVLLLIPGIPAALWLGDSVGQSAMLIVSLVFIILMEVINSAIEAIIDRIGDDPHRLSRRAKDLGSAAVMIACLNAIVIWAVMALAKFGFVTL